MSPRSFSTENPEKSLETPSEKPQETLYSKAFYDNQSQGSRRSAEVVVPLVRQLLPVNSVVDIGCGVGTWLSVFQETGSIKVHGFDGSYVDVERLYISKDDFTPWDLTRPNGIPQALGEKVDLAVSLEVAEHLPDSSSDQFVQTLTELSDVVLFSAAIPHQGGVGHINEQWPDYWAQKFESLGYLTVDAIRPQIWTDAQVSWWYAQNILLFVKFSALIPGSPLEIAHHITDRRSLSKVHPTKYLSIARKKVKKPFWKRLNPLAFRSTLKQR